MSSVDIEYLKTWVGASKEARDILTPRLAQQLTALLSPYHAPQADGYAPLASQWLLSPDAADMNDLGVDGHPAKGGFLPPVPLPNRMWAGGEIESFSKLKVGDNVIRCSQVMDVTHKEGKSGELVFVAVQHEYFSDNGLVIRERQDLVYREIKPVSKPTPAVVKSRPIDTRCDKQWCINASTPLLFRYSALTFNGHRIHYDLPYAQNEEFYEGLVVQGPLQASFLFNLAAEVLGQAPSHFSYRGVNPLIAGQDFWVQARVISSGVIECWVSDFQGDTTMKASASINTGVGE